MRRWPITAVLACGLSLTMPDARAQQLDLTHGGPINITAVDGIEWRQAEQEVIALGDAKATRGNVTVSGDRLTAWYRKKGAAGRTQPAQPASQPAKSVSEPASGIGGDTSTEGNEIYRLQADGNVHIFTQTDEAQGDRAIYDLDQAVMVMTGRNLKLTTPNDVLTARDDLEYWPQKHMAVARGNAVVVTNDGKRVSADTLVAYTQDAAPPASGGTQASASGVTPAAAKTSGATQASAKSSDDPMAASGKLQKVEAYGNVSIRTQTDTVTGERGVYVPDTGMARIAGNVQITRGQNQLNGAEADVNMKTGVAKLIASHAGRVHGLVLPNDESNKSLTNDPAAPDKVPTKPALNGAPAAQTGSRS